MVGDYPFNSHRVHFEQNVPNPMVELLERDERGNEKVLDGDVDFFYKKYPLSKKCFSLQELLEAGEPLKAVNPAIYGSNDSSDYGFTINDIYEAAQELAPKLNQNKLEE